MFILNWIALGLVSLLLAVAGVFWLVAFLLDDSDWRRLALRVYRWAKVGLLFYVNAAIYAHVFSALF